MPSPRSSTTIALLVVVVAATLTIIEAFQPTSFTFDRIRYTFYPGEIARTWNEADAFCQSLNKELAVFANRGQIRNVSEYLSPEGGVWTGYRTNADGRFEAAELAEFEWKKEFGTPLLSRSRPDLCGLLSVANYTGVVATDCDTRKAALCSVSDPDIVDVETMMDAKSGLAPTAPKPTQPKLSSPANKTSTAKRAAEAKPPAPAPKPTPEATRSKKADPDNAKTSKKTYADADDAKSMKTKANPDADDAKTSKDADATKKADADDTPTSKKADDKAPTSKKTYTAAAAADDDKKESPSNTSRDDLSSKAKEPKPAKAKSATTDDDDGDDDDDAPVEDAENGKQAAEERRQLEEDRRKAAEDRKKAEEERKKAEEERKRAAEERKRAADDKKKNDDDKKKFADAKKKVSDAKKKVADDKKKKKPKAKADEDEDADADAEAADESSELAAPTTAPPTRTPTNQLPVQVESEGGRFTFFPNRIMFGGYMEYARFCEDKGLQPAVFTSRKQLDDVAAHVQSVVMVWTGYTTDTMGGVHSADEKNGSWSEDFVVPDAEPAAGLSCGALATIGERVGVVMGSCASAHEALCSAKPFTDVKKK